MKIQKMILYFSLVLLSSTGFAEDIMPGGLKTLTIQGHLYSGFSKLGRICLDNSYISEQEHTRINMGSDDPPAPFVEKYHKYLTDQRCFVPDASGNYSILVSTIIEANGEPFHLRTKVGLEYWDVKSTWGSSVLTIYPVEWPKDDKSKRRTLAESYDIKFGDRNNDADYLKNTKIVSSEGEVIHGDDPDIVVYGGAPSFIFSSDQAIVTINIVE